MFNFKSYYSLSGKLIIILASIFAMVVFVVLTFGNSIIQGWTSSQESSQASVQTLVEKLTGPETQVIDVFKTPIPELTGIVLETPASDKKLIAWAIQGHLITGHIFTDTGEDLLEKYQKKYNEPSVFTKRLILDNQIIKVPVQRDVQDIQNVQQDLAETEKPVKPALDDITQAAHIPLFDDFDDIDAPQKILYVIADPNCIYCHKFYTLIQKIKSKLVEKGVQVNWVPVALLNDTSIFRSMAILKNGRMALAANEDYFDEKTHEGGIPAPDSPEVVQKMTKELVALKKNNALFERLSRLAGDEMATPTLIMQNIKQSTWKIHVGSLSDVRLEQWLTE